MNELDNQSQDDRAEAQPARVELYDPFEAMFAVKPPSDEFGELFEQASSDEF